MKTKVRLSLPIIFLSYAVFIGVWAVWIVLHNSISLGELGSWTVAAIVYVIWWPCFAMCLLKRFEGEVRISLGEMIKTPPNLKLLLPLMVFAVLYHVGVYVFDSDGFSIEMKPYDFIWTVMTVGFFEEIVFRGWFLNALSSRLSERKANLISAALFTAMHYPSYIYHSYGIVNILSVSVGLYAMGLIFGYAFRKSRSIWTGAIFHSFWDMLSFIM